MNKQAVVVVNYIFLAGKCSAERFVCPSINVGSYFKTKLVVVCLQVYPDSVHITAVLVEYTTPTGRLTKGVATSWLKAKQPDNGRRPTVPMYIRKSQFRLPFKPATPIIMIGPGTGLAPFRGFIQERDFLVKEGRRGIKLFVMPTFLHSTQCPI
jgi:hypothetical protein